MAETYTITAKTVQEATEKARKLYEIGDNEISISIVETGKKGFLGIGAKDAVIRVTVTSKKDADLDDIVNSIKDSKRLTDRYGAEPEKNTQKKQNNNNNNSAKQNNNGGNNQNKPKNNNNNNANAPKNDNKPAKTENKPEQKNENKQSQGANANSNKQNNNSGNQNKPKNENKPVSNNQPKKLENKPAKPEIKAEKTETKTADKPVENKPVHKPVNNQPKNENKTVKPEIKAEKPETKPAKKADNGIVHSEVVVSAPQGLFDMPEKPVNYDGFAKINAANAAAREAENSNPIVKPVVPASKAKPIEEKKPVKTAIETIEKAKAIEDEIEEEIEAESEASDTPVKENSVKVAVTEEEMEYALAFANTLLRDMQIDAEAKRGQCPEGETFETTETATVYPRIEINGEGTGILVGHHGETLDAIQYLVNLSAMRRTKQTAGSKNDYVKIVVDVGDYRVRREETLRALARRMAQKAVKTKRNIFLEPMNAYERRIIHSELQEYENVSTHSIGADKNRKIIITYEGADKVSYDRNSRGSRKPKNETSEEREERRNSRPRPKKRPKMPIEKIGDVLTTGNESESTQNTEE